LPKKWNREQFASAELMMGANHIRVRCYDGVTRMGRIKGKIKKRVWIREGDILIVTPWSFQDEKCDILYRYLPPQVEWLRRNRYILTAPRIQSFIHPESQNNNAVFHKTV
jgi:translation initiation factor 1A